MNINKLSQKMENNKNKKQEFKNYKELCEFLEIPVQAGNSKKAQLSMLEQYCKIQKKGHKFIIKEIYKNPIIIDKKQLGNNSIYQKHINLILLDYLSKHFTNNDIEYINLTTSRIAEIIGLINNQYIICKQDIARITEEINVTKKDIDNFYRKASIKLNEIINVSLKKLVSQRILNVRKTYMIRENIDVFNKENERIATRDEEVDINDIERDVLKEFGYQYIYQVYNNMVAGKFYKIVNERLFKEYGWTYCYKIYSLGFTKFMITSGIDQLQKELMIVNNEKNTVNNKMVNYFNKQTDEQYKKNIESVKESLELIHLCFIGEDEGIKELPENFIENQKKIIDKLIKIIDFM